MCVCEVVWFEFLAEAFPLAVEDEEEFVGSEGPVFVGETESAVELRVVTESFFDPWHADEDDGDVGAVIFVSDEFECFG